MWINGTVEIVIVHSEENDANKYTKNEEQQHFNKQINKLMNEYT